MTATRRLALPLLLLLSLAGACGDDKFTAPQPGTINVAVQPEDLDPRWVLTGPEGYEHEGVGEETLAGLTPGNYTLAWQDVAGYVTPNTVTVTLSTGGTSNILGTYLPAP